MGELIFVGLGLHSEDGISLRGLEETRGADSVFAELYTSFMPGLSFKKLERLVEKRISVVSRQDLEEKGGQIILREARKRTAVFLVPGDPLIATTHIDLRIRAERQGIKTRVIHGASIVSAVIGLAGLQHYKFGRCVTIPLRGKNFVSEVPYQTIMENNAMGLHTLCLLDIKAEEKRYATIKDGLQELLSIEKLKKCHLITMVTLAVGIARAGSMKPVIKAGYVSQLFNYEFGEPPHTLIFPARLHFMEAEALVTLANAPEQIKEKT